MSNPKIDPPMVHSGSYPMLQFMQQNLATVFDNFPFAQAIGIVCVSLERGRATARLPYHPDLIGDVETGTLHGGVITALLDNVAGVAIAAGLERVTSIATLDLRVDYMMAAQPGRDVFAMAELVRATRRIAFFRALAFHDSETDPIAIANGTFALASNSGRGPGHNEASASRP